jgi:hypothetical protein
VRIHHLTDETHARIGEIHTLFPIVFATIDSLRGFWPDVHLLAILLHLETVFLFGYLTFVTWGEEVGNQRKLKKAQKLQIVSWEISETIEEIKRNKELLSKMLSNYGWENSRP